MREFTSDRDPAAEPDFNPLKGVSFTLDGVKFACEGEPDLLDEAELNLLATQAADFRSPQAKAAVAAFLQMAFGPQVYGLFRMHTKAYHTPPEVVLAIVDGIREELEERVVAEAGRPTGLPSAFSPGAPGTDEDLSKLTSWGTGDIQVVGQPAGTQPETRARPVRKKDTEREDIPHTVVKIGSTASKAG